MKPAAGTAALASRVGRVVCGGGLALFYGGMVLPAMFGGLDVPAIVWRVGLVLATVGCLLLVALLAWPALRPQRAFHEVRYGFACVPAAGLAVLGATGEGPHEIPLFWPLAAVFLVPATVALIVLAGLVERKVDGGRARPHDR